MCSLCVCVCVYICACERAEPLVSPLLDDYIALFPAYDFSLIYLFIYLGLKKEKKKKKSKSGAEVLPLLLNSGSWETALPFHGDFLLLETSLEAKPEGRPPLASTWLVVFQLADGARAPHARWEHTAQGTWHVDPQLGAITPQGPQSAAHGFSSMACDFQV